MCGRGPRSENGHDTHASRGRPLRENPGGLLGFGLNWQLAPRRRRVPFEDEAPAGLMIGGVGPEEIDPHPFQLFGAIAREGLDAIRRRDASRASGEASRGIPDP